MREVLEQLGFTTHEAEIYLCLFENGSLSAYDLGDRTGFYRQACYDTLNRMIEKGVVTQQKEGKRRVFQAVEPEFLLEQLREKESLFLAALPALLSRKRSSQNAVSVEVFQGKNVLHIAALDIIKTMKKHGGENCSTGADEKLLMRMFGSSSLRILEQFDREMRKNKFRERVIIQEGAMGVMSPDVTTYRSVPKKYFNHNVMQIYGNTVQILLVGKPSHLIIIRNEEIADSFRKQFELMWLFAKPVVVHAKKRAKKKR